jgi:hypothetical protein
VTMGSGDQRLPPHRVRRGELLSAGSALLLLISMFAFEWYGVAGIPGRSAKLIGVENGWESLSVVRWVMLLSIVVAVGSVLLRATQQSHGAQTSTGVPVAALGAVTAALLAYRVLIAFPSADQVVDQKLGAFVGLASAIGIVLGGYDCAREERAHMQLLVQRSRSRNPVAGRRAAQ